MTKDYLTGLRERLQDVDYAIAYLAQREKEEGMDGYVRAWDDIMNAHPDDHEQFWRETCKKRWRRQKWQRVKNWLFPW